MGRSSRRPEPVDVALRALTLAANHGKIWMGSAAAGALAGGAYRRAGLRGLGSLAVASFVSNSLVKPLVGRRRPDLERTQLARRIGERPWTSSFPSGHSASAAAFATGAALELPVAGVAWHRWPPPSPTPGCTSASTTRVTSWSAPASESRPRCWSGHSGRSASTARPSR